MFQGRGLTKSVQWRWGGPGQRSRPTMSGFSGLQSAPQEPCSCTRIRGSMRNDLIEVWWLAWGAHRGWGGSSAENRRREKVEISTTQGNLVSVSSSRRTRTQAYNRRTAWWRTGGSVAGYQRRAPWSGSNGEAERPRGEGKESRATTVGALIAERGSRWAWGAAWRARCGGPGERQRNVGGFGRERNGEEAHGPHLEVVGRPGKKRNGSGPRNNSPFLFIHNFFKRLELIWSKEVLTNL
jgi:hypothetical protein